MTPSTAGLLEQDFEIEEEESRTYRMVHRNKRILGSVDGLEAVQQAAFKILNTERYQHVIYSWDYGIETMDLYGEPVSYVCPELERRIVEALICDSRITDVSDFDFEIMERGAVLAAFTVSTIYGAIQMEKEVDI